MHDEVLESAFGICASKWSILDKATETKLDTGVEIVKCISLLHNIIIDFEGYFCLHSLWSQHDSLSLPPTRATRKQRTNRLGRCYQPERPFRTLTRYTPRRRTAPFTYMCLSAQVSGRETRVHAGRWHAGRSLKPGTHYPHVTWAHIKFMFYFQLLPYPFPRIGSHMLISIIWWPGVI